MKRTNRNRIFFRLVILNVVGLVAAFLIFGKFFFTSHPLEVHEYRYLMSNAENAKKGNSSTPYNAKQERVGVLKEVLFNEGANRQQLRLTASDSQLVFDHHSNDQTEIVENMHQVKCLMQEELFYLLPNGKEAVLQSNGRLLIRHGDIHASDSWVDLDAVQHQPMQIIRLMEADEAAYYYTSDRFLAYKVKLSRYMLPGHKLVPAIGASKPIMSGIAEKVEFSMSGKINFKATQLKATFFNARRSS